MTDNIPAMPTPDPALGRFDRLVGTRRLTGHLDGSDDETITGIDGDDLTISVNEGPLDATYHGSFSDDGNTFAGGWRPNAGADPVVNVAYDVSGSRVSQVSPAGASDHRDSATPALATVSTSRPQ